MEPQSASSSLPQTPPNFRRTEIPVKWGLIAGLLACVVTTVGFMYILPRSYVGFLATTMVLGFVLTLVLAGLAAGRQRTALGGYITFKDAYSAVFIVLLLTVLISAIYGVIYVKYIDPASVDRMKEATLTFMEGMKAPQEKLDEAAEQFEKQRTAGLQPGRLAYSTAQSLIVYSLFGLIPAAIVRRKRPEGGMR